MCSNSKSCLENGKQLRPHEQPLIVGCRPGQGPSANLSHRTDGTVGSPAIVEPERGGQSPLRSKSRRENHFRHGHRRAPHAPGRPDPDPVRGTADEFRVSTLPVVDGEKVVMRLSSSERAVLTLDQIGFGTTNLRLMQSSSRGRTGSSWSPGRPARARRRRSTPRSSSSKRDTINIVTVEDPVEYELAGINQVQVNAKAGLTFATGLRSILRQDPDVDPGRRDPRPGDGRDRHPGRADRPPGALHAAHQRRARRRSRA